ncbi:PD-(D/E)XK nuclease domain-containing protein, partial [Salmonella enterica]|nr:PD-(D/E)XK nuclease domain-containing protein [Salmonella enterica]
FDSFLAGIPYNVRRRADERERERDFTYTLYLVFRIASCYVTYVEKQQSYGRLDCAVETRDSVYVFEFKMDRPVEEAMAQIDAMGYADEFAASGKKVFKVGVSISSERGRLDGWAVEEA